MIVKVRTHSLEVGSFQLSQEPPNTERATVLYGDGIGLLRLLALDRLHSKKPLTGRLQRRLR
jgi:hypothetical protein